MHHEIEDVLDRLALEQGVTREEILAIIARDWLIGLGYLHADESDEVDLQLKMSQE